MAARAEGVFTVVLAFSWEASLEPVFEFNQRRKIFSGLTAVERRTPTNDHQAILG